MSHAEVTRDQAEAVLAVLEAKYADELENKLYPRPKLVEGWDYLESGPSAFAILWEEGPYEWTMRFPEGGIDPELAELAAGAGAGGSFEEPPLELPECVWVEPATMWAISIYPKD